jgi:hypothetical protein
MCSILILGISFLVFPRLFSSKLVSFHKFVIPFTTLGRMEELLTCSSIVLSIPVLGGRLFNSFGIALSISGTSIMKAFFAFLLALAAIVHGGFPPQPQGVTTVSSKRTPGVSISYKEVCSDASMILVRSLPFQSSVGTVPAQRVSGRTSNACLTSLQFPLGWRGLRLFLMPTKSRSKLHLRRLWHWY